MEINNVVGDTGDPYDFGLVVTRTLTQSGSYIVYLNWTHISGQYGYNIYRAESISDSPNDWYKVNSSVIQINSFEDRGFAGGIPVGNERIAWYYKVVPVSQAQVQLPLSKSTAVTFSEPLSGIQAYILPTIRMRTNMMLDPKGFSSAEPVHFFVRKWAGEYCSCVNVRTGEHDSACPKCYGSMYIGGYSLIENVFTRIRSAKKQLLAEAPGITISQNPTFATGVYPRIADGDILVRAHNVRYRIRNPKLRQSQGYATAQSGELEAMQLFDMGYRLSAPPIVQPVERIEGGNVLGGVMARPEGNALNGGRGGGSDAPAQLSEESSILDGEIESSTAETFRSGSGTGRGYVGFLPSQYPPSP
jgi:hypothetical protein